MAIQPIDLQTLFSQLERVGKTQAEQTQGAQIQQSVQGAMNQRKMEMRTKTVNEVPPSGDGVGKIKDDKKKKSHEQKAGAEGKEAAEDEVSEADTQPGIFKDPGLGKNIDLSG